MLQKFSHRNLFKPSLFYVCMTIHLINCLLGYKGQEFSLASPSLSHPSMIPGKCSVKVWWMEKHRSETKTIGLSAHIKWVFNITNREPTKGE